VRQVADRLGLLRSRAADASSLFFPFTVFEENLCTNIRLHGR
jgi:hypothetical protein